jgi:hypothetical protein
MTRQALSISCYLERRRPDEELRQDGTQRGQVREEWGDSSREERGELRDLAHHVAEDALDGGTET